MESIREMLQAIYRTTAWDGAWNMSEAQRAFYASTPKRRCYIARGCGSRIFGRTMQAIRAIERQALRARMAFAARSVPPPSPITTSVDHRRWW